MRILLIARTCPYPPDDGEKIRVFNLVKNLSHHQITLVCRTMNEQEMRGLSELERFCINVNGIHIPSPTSNIERLRWLFPFVFSRYPVSLSTVFFKQMVGTLRTLTRHNDFDIIQIEHSLLSVYLDYMVLGSGAKRVVTLHNIEHVRNMRVMRHLEWGCSKLYLAANQMVLKKWELSALERFDRIITVSELDRDILINAKPCLRIEVVPNGVDVDTIEFKPRRNPPPSLVFVGSMNSEANHDAAIFFLKKIFPLVKKRYKNASIFVVGRDPKPELVALGNGSDIVVTGKVENVLDYYRSAAVAVVPIRSGGGTRLKILEAMATGVPVVSTSVGCEGLNVENQVHLLVADNPRDFSICINQLIDDVGCCQGLIERARDKVEKEYDWKGIAKQHDDVYRSLLSADG